MKVIDPVCGMSVDSNSATATYSYQNHAYYFCSDHCRDEFKAHPDRYLGKGTVASTPGAGTGGPVHGAGQRH